jgi:hypothetical protein
VKTIQRTITNLERSELERLYSSSQTRKNRLWIMLAGFFAQWFGSMLGIVVFWIILSWLANFFTKFDFSFQSLNGVMLLKVMILITAIWSALQNWQWFNRAPNIRAVIAKDITEGMVVEDQYHFIAAKCFCEPEHGGLMYFLLDEKNRTYVVFDYESQNLNDNMAHSSNSQLCPMTNLSVVRAPQSKLMIRQEFSGERLQADNPREITLSPEYWPELNAFCNIKWNDLERKLCK